MKKILIILFVSISNLCVSAQTSNVSSISDASEADITTGSLSKSTSSAGKSFFSLSGNNIGSLANSVNLFSGDVNLPLNLLSLPGKSGLDLNLSLFYSSNIQNTVTKRNLEASTGILGLGWSYPVSKIIADTKGTVTLEDDDYYLQDGGNTNQLIRSGLDGTSKTYIVKNYAFWKIKYDITNEKWEIIKEDGTTFIFGDKNSGRNTVEYLISWGNWIGNSSVVEGQTRTAAAWNLSEMKNLYNDNVLFQYKFIEESVGLGTLKYTKASYLEKITDSFGRQIEYSYAEKTADEYQDPHQEASEPDAYQDKYETEYLNYITVKDANSQVLYSFYFSYASLGTGQFTKRTLTKIQQKDRANEYSPEINFAYNPLTETNNPGALSTVSPSQGGSVSYVYDKVNLGKSKRELVVDAPTGYSAPNIWVRDNYVVILWRSSNGTGNYGKLEVYEWNGQWVKGVEDNLDNANIFLNEDNFNFTFQSNFFAILCGTYSLDQQGMYLHIFRKNENTNLWEMYYESSTRSDDTEPYLVSGENFVGVKYHKYPDGKVQTYTLYSGIWRKDPITDSFKAIENPGDGYQDAATSAGINYLFIHNMRNANPDNGYYNYLTEMREWKNKPIYFGAGQNAQKYTHWACTNNFMMGANYNANDADGMHERIYRWDPNQENFYAYDISDDFEKKLSIQQLGIFIASNFSNGYYGPYQDYSGGPAHYQVYYSVFDGLKWNTKFLNNIQYDYYKYDRSFNFGSDYIIVNNYTSVALHWYNPKTLSWNSQTFNHGYEYPRIIATDMYCAVEREFYFRNLQGNWALKKSLPDFDGNGLQGILKNQIYAGGNFIQYNFENLNGNKSAKIFLLNNGEFTTEEPDDIPDWYGADGLAGNDIFVLINTSDIAAATKATLYKVINNSYKGEIVDYPVKTIITYDGSKNSYVSYKYEAATAKADISGQIAQYNLATIIPGVSDPALTTYPAGYTEAYHFNGLPNAELSVKYPTGDTCTNADSYFKLLTGQVYATRAYSGNAAAHSLVSSNDTYYKVRIVKNAVDSAYFIRAEKTCSDVQGVKKYSVSSYSPLNGSVKKNRSYSIAEDVYTTEYTYLKEAYPAITQNLLTSIVQTKTYHNSTVTGITATTWKQWAAGWAPHKTYIRKTVPLSTDQFDFAGWSNTNEPGADWQKTSEIISIDSKGRALETADLDGIRTSTVWNKRNEAISTFTNASSTAVFADDFNSIENSWSGANLENGYLKFSNANEAQVNSNISVVQTNCIYEYDVRIGSYRTVSDWAGFQFRKTAAGDSPWNSGYTVFLRQNRTLELYRNNVSLGSYLIPGISDDWQRIRIVCKGQQISVYLNGAKVIDVSDNSFSGSYFGFHSYFVESYWDNLRIYPAEAYASSTSFNPDFGYAEASYPEDGNVVKYVYNSRNELIGTINPLGIPSETISSSLSTDRNSSYTASDPNVVLSSRVQGTSGLYESFDTHLNKWVKIENANTATSSWTIQNGKLVNANTGGSSTSVADFLYYDLGQELTGRVAIEASVTVASINNANFGIAAGGDSWDISNNNGQEIACWAYFQSNSQMRVYNGSYNEVNYTFKAGYTYRIRFLLDIESQQADVYIDGKLYLSQIDFRSRFNNVQTTGIRKIAFFNYGLGKAASWSVDNLMVYTDPIQTMSFVDAAGKTLQTQSDEAGNKAQPVFNAKFDGSLTGWTVKENANNSASTWSIQNGGLVHTNDGMGGTANPKNYACDFLSYNLGRELSGTVVMEATVKMPSSTLADLSLGIALGGDTWDISNYDGKELAVWTVLGGNGWYDYTSSAAWQYIVGNLQVNYYYRFKIVIDQASQKIDYYINGRLCKSKANFRAASTGIQKIAFYNYGFAGSSNTWTIDDILIYTENQILISQTLYDDLGRGHIQTKTTRYAGPFGYKTDFANLNTTTWEMSGKVVENNGGEKFPYSRTVFENSPLGRVTETSIPGATYKIGGGKTTRYTYTAEYVAGTNLNESYPAIKSTDPQGIVVTSIKDKWGRKIKEYSGPVRSKGTKEDEVSVNYNSPVKTFTPNVSGTAKYVYDRYASNSPNFEITDANGNTVISKSVSSSGDFQVTGGVQYTVRLGILALAKTQNQVSGNASVMAPPYDLSTGRVTYETWVEDLDIYPTTTYDYDIYGNLIEILPPNYYDPPSATVNKSLYRITNTYSFLGQLTQTTSSDAGTIKYIYDKAGRLRFSMDALGEAQSTDNIKYTKYDVLGRVIEEGYISSMNWNQTTLQTNADNRVWPSTPATWRKKYYYGDLGTDSYQRSKLVKIEVNNDADNTADVIESFVYDKMGSQASYSLKATPYNTTTYSASYSYDNEGKTTKIVYPNASVVTYSYDRLGRTLNIGTPSAAAYFASYNYDKNGLMQSEEIYNDNYLSEYTYNVQGRLVNIYATAFSQTLVYETGGYGGATNYNGMITRSYYLSFMEGRTYDRTIYYKYDNLGRLLVADNSGNDAGDIGVGSETKYDANGNILTIKKNATTGQYVYYPGTSRLQNANGSTASNYIYDNNGNLISSSTKGITGISYDPYFNLTTAITRSSGVLSFKYGATDQRVYSNYSGTSPEKTLYFHGLGEYPLMERAGEGDVRLYVYGPTGLVAFQKYGDWNFVQKDYLGSIRATFNEYDFEQKYQSEFSPYGSLILENINVTSPDYKFTGQEYDEETGLYNFRARLYDPDLGIFLGVDPAQQNYAPFSYCGNNPVMMTDPSGEFFFTALAAIFAQPLLPLAIGADIGMYSGGAIANNNANPFKWDFTSGKTWGYMGVGAAIGGLSTGAGVSVAGTGIPFANTLGTMTSSFVSSLGNHILSGGQTDLNISLGVASYNFSKGEWGYFGKGGNSSLDNMSYFLGGMSNAADINLLINNTAATLYTDASDAISHSAVVDKDGGILMSYGPDHDQSSYLLLESDLKSKIVGGKQSLGSKGNYKKFAIALQKSTTNYPVHSDLPINIRVNKYIFELTRLGSYLPYQGATINCVNMSSLSLWLNGIPNIGLHSYLLYGTTWAYSNGIRADIFSHFLRGY